MGRSEPDEVESHTLRLFVDPDGTPAAVLPDGHEIHAHQSLRDTHGPHRVIRLGLGFRGTEVSEQMIRFLFVLGLARIDKREPVSLERAALAWPSSTAESLRKGLCRHFAARKEFLTRNTTDTRLVDVDEVTRGPYLINRAYSVEADARALRSYLAMGTVVVEKLPSDILTVTDLLSRAAELEAGVSVRELRSLYAAGLIDLPRLTVADRHKLLRRLAATELKVGLADEALEHARLAGRLTASGAPTLEQLDAIHLQAVAFRQLGRFRTAIDLDAQALELLDRVRPRGAAWLGRHVSIYRSIGESRSRLVFKKEGPRAAFVARYAEDAEWKQAEAELNHSLLLGADLGNNQEADLSLMFRARHGLRKATLLVEDTAAVAHTDALGSQLGPYWAVVWARTKVSAAYLRSRDQAETDAMKQDLQARAALAQLHGFENQVRLVSDVLIGKKPIR